MSTETDFKPGSKVRIAPALIQDPVFTKLLTMQGIDPQKLEQAVGIVRRSGTMNNGNTEPYNYAVVQFPSMNFPASEQKYERQFSQASLLPATETVALRPAHNRLRRVRGKMPMAA
jgi:hypothetical protein